MHKKQRLDDHPLFAYVAWITLIGFAVFVYFLAQELRAAVNDLERSISTLEARLPDTGTSTADLEAGVSDE